MYIGFRSYCKKEKIVIFRFTKKAISNLKLPTLSTIGASNNLFHEWFVNVFYSGQRYKYYISTNAATLFSIIMHGKGVVDDSIFFRNFFSSLRELLEDNDCAFIYRRYIETNNNVLRLSNTNSRSILSSMNELVVSAKVALDYHELSPYDASKFINATPMGLINMEYPQEYIKKIKIDE